MSESLLQRIACGDSLAVRDCIEQYGALVWSLARRFSPTVADAEDATQEIFIALWQSAARFDATTGSETVFIATIARRRLIDRLRKNATDMAARSLHEAEQAPRALADLRCEHRQVLELAFLQGLTQTEIATRLSIPLETVKTYMRHGFLQMRAAQANPATHSSALG